jgi:hypothetical protein
MSQYCTIFVVCNPTMTPNVQCCRYLVPLYITGLRYFSLLNTNCNVLGYWWHRSICYTSLFMIPLVVTTIYVYSVLWPSDAVSRNGPLTSSVICSVISLHCLYLGVSCISETVSLLCMFYLGVSSISSVSIKVKVKVTLRLTVSQSLSLGFEPYLELMTRYLLLFDRYGLVFCGAPSLTWGRVCRLYMLLALASAVWLGSESLGPVSICVCRPLNRVFAPGHLPSRLHFRCCGFPTIWLLRNS